MTKITPLGNRVLLQFTKEPDPEPGTLILPDSLSKKERYLEVVAIGSSDSIQVKVGDKIILDKYAHQEVEIEDERYFLAKAEDILAVISTYTGL